MNTTVLTPVPSGGGYVANPQQQRQPRQGMPDSKTHEAPYERRSLHLAAALAAFFLAFAMLVVIAFHGYIAWMLAYPYVAPLTSNPMEAKGLVYEELRFSSVSGQTEVDGWFIPAEAAPSERTVIFSHGYGANREEPWVPMYELAHLLHQLNYHVLMFDYGYANTANKAPATGGYEESGQLLAAIKEAQARGAQEIIVWGFSMGGGTALQAALQTTAIDALILDSMFLPDPETLFHNVTQLIDLPRFPSLPLIQALLPVWTGTSFEQIPAEQVKQTAYSIPILLMHGTSDSKAPVAIAQNIAATQTHPLSRSWFVENGYHEMLYRLHPKEYIQRASAFLHEVGEQRRYDVATAASS